jgi:DegV family protein with EDD domain
MSKVRIVVDSTADLSEEERSQLNIEMVPLKVHFGEETFLDSITINSEKFFQKLEQSKDMPSTSQPSPADFVDIYRKLLDEADAPILSIHISSALSGTYQSATIAKSMLEDDPRITIVDSKSASVGFGFGAKHAAKLAASGADVNECLKTFQRINQGSKLYFLVETLDYLQRNGRIGKASALFGSLLSIKPILSIDTEGTIYPVDRIRGSRKAMSRVVELLDQDFQGRKVNINIAHANALPAAEQFASMLGEKLTVASISYNELGPVIGAHVGPGTLGVLCSPLE